MTGQRIGRLTVLGRSPATRKSAYWVCQCGCGEKLSVPGHALRRANGFKSCGCLKKERAGGLNKKHGLSGTKEHKIWCGMRDRCNRPNNLVFKHYGGRGIKVCARWDSFELFLADMGPLPAPDYSIERIEVDGDYCPENCCWIPLKEQNNNKRNSRAAA